MRKVILIYGLQGSGKTTLAAELGKVLKGVVLTTEAIRHELFGNKDSMSNSDFTETELKITYRTVELMLKNIIDYCNLIIIDGVFRYSNQRDNISEICKMKNVKLITYYLTCSEITAKKRLEDRKAQNESQLGDYQAYLSVKERFEYPKNGEIIIDTSEASLNNTLIQVLDDINQR